MDRDDYWTVEYRNGVWGWQHDGTGPHALYDTREQAHAWAVKLASIQRHVRLKHVVQTYEEVHVSG